MKVVLFCGGLGLRVRDYSDKIPKPLVPIGYRPVLWHIMKYYAHFGHKDFILCLGYKSDAIKRYFLEYNEWLTNDFVLSGDGNPELLKSDIQDWRITFVDTGLHANIGERLRKVKPYLAGEEMFLANYSDDLTDAPLNDWVADLRTRPEAVGSFVAVNPSHLSFHNVRVADDGIVQDIKSITESDVLINGGYFVFKQDIFDYLEPGEELVEEPFKRLIDRRALVAYRHKGFWGALDTFKDHQYLEELYLSGAAPWELWRSAETDLLKAEC